MRGNTVSPERVAAVVYRALKQQGLEVGSVEYETVSRTPLHGRSHSVKEFFFEVLGGSRPLVVSVRIADRRPMPFKTAAPEENKGPYHFDASGIPLLDEEQ